MNVSILCSSRSHPVWAYLADFSAKLADTHSVTLTDDRTSLPGGDMLFLVSCTEIIGADVLARYGNTLVVHASDLPEGRGWSPAVWQILEGRNEIVVSLLEASERVDAGAIWAKRRIELEGHELFDEIHDSLFRTELDLMQYAIEQRDEIEPMEQPASGISYYPRRNPDDSRLDPDKNLAEQFDLLRVCDPNRYPAFFHLRGHRYELRIVKSTREDND